MVRTTTHTLKLVILKNCTFLTNNLRVYYKKGGNRNKFMYCTVSRPCGPRLRRALPLPRSPLLRSVFFLDVRKKVGVKAFFCQFFVFFTGKISFSRALFSGFLGFFTRKIFFHGHFFIFFHGQKKRFHGQHFQIFVHFLPF